MKQKFYFLCTLFWCAILSFGQTLDQSNAPSDVGGGNFTVSPSQNLGQSFTAGISGDLSQINIRIGNFQNVFFPGDFQIRIFNGEGYSGTVLNTTTFTISTPPVTNDYQELTIPLSANIPITSGSVYTIDFRGTTGSVVTLATNNIYANGGLYFSNGNNAPFSIYDLWFKTFVTVPATHLNLDGVNDFIALPNESNFDFTNQMTVEAWVKSNVAPEQWDALVIKGDNSWRLHLNSTGTVNFTCSGTSSSQVNSTSSVTDGNWHHVVGTLGGNSIKIYIDGVLENVVATSGNINNTVDQVLIGNNPTFGPRHFNGNMEDVRIWNVARTAEQINGSKNCELQGNESGLVAYYKFNQGLDAADNTAITTLTDATANANNGTLFNFANTGATSNFLAGSPVTTGSIIPSVATVTTPVTYTQGATATALTATVGANGSSLVWYTTATGGTGTTAPTPSTATVGSTSYWVSSTNANGCESARTEILVQVALPATHLNFDGVNDNVNCGNHPSLQISGNQITLQAMIYATNWKNQIFEGGVLVKNGFPNNDVGYYLRVGQNGSLNAAFGNGSTVFQIDAFNVLSLNTWQQITATYDGTAMKLYVNGDLVSTVNASFSISSPANNLFIGADIVNSGRNFPGSIDEVRIWNRALTATEIVDTKNCELQGNETGLAAYYKFNQGLDAADNTAVITLNDATANANNGTLFNFANTGATSNFLAGSPVTTGSIIPSVATVTTPVTYAQGATATALTATVGANGSSLVWYTTATGGTGITVPTPSTATVGSTSYWVSSANANGCESARTEIVVTVNSVPATHLNFDGVNDFVDLGTSNLLKPTTAITLELNAFMLNWSSAADLETIIGNAQNGGWFIGVEGTNLVAGVRRNGGYGKALFPLSSLSSGWHHIAMDYGGGYVHMFIDGVYVSENNAGGTFPITYSVANSTIIGSEATGTPGAADLSRCFNGNIDDVRIWNSVRTPSQIANNKDCELLGTETGLIAYYKFNHGNSGVDNTSITSLTDATANANDGTLTNFALTGSTSNFLSGSPIVTGTTCTTLNVTNFEVSNNIKMYPNPTNNIVTVEVNDLTNAKLQVVDITGKILMNQVLNTSSNTVDVQQLPTGMYLFKVSSNEGTTTNKIIKN